MIKHLKKSRNIDAFGKINEIVFIENYFILLSDYFNNDTYCNIIKTNFFDYRNTYNLLEKKYINPNNFLQKIDESTLFINSFKDFIDDYFRLKGLKIVFPFDFFKENINNEMYKPIFYWVRNQNYIVVYTKINFKAKKDVIFKICIFNTDKILIKEIPLIYLKKQNFYKQIFSKKNLIGYLYEYKYCKKYFAFVCNGNLFVLNFETVKIVKYELDMSYKIQEINDEIKSF